MAVINGGAVNAAVPMFRRIIVGKAVSRFLAINREAAGDLGLAPAGVAIGGAGCRRLIAKAIRRGVGDHLYRYGLGLDDRYLVAVGCVREAILARIVEGGCFGHGRIAVRRDLGGRQLHG